MKLLPGEEFLPGWEPRHYCDKMDKVFTLALRKYLGISSRDFQIFQWGPR